MNACSYLNAASWPYPKASKTAAHSAWLPSEYEQSVSVWIWRTGNNPDGSYQVIFTRMYAGGSRGWTLWMNGNTVYVYSFQQSNYVSALTACVRSAPRAA